MDMILSIGILITIFIGLISMLWFCNRIRRATDDSAVKYNEQFMDWFVHHNYRYPSIHEMLNVINIQAKSIRPIQGGEQWVSLNIDGLLPKTQLPTFEITSLPVINQDCIVAKLLIEWPQCLPGLEVSVKDEKNEKVTCHLQVDWIIVTGELSIKVVDQGGVKLSWQQATPTTSMSCLVMSPAHWKADIDIMKPITEGDRDTERSENMASSVTEGIINLLNELSITDLFLPLHKKQEMEPEMEQEIIEKENEKDEDDNKTIQQYNETTQYDTDQQSVNEEIRQQQQENGGQENGGQENGQQENRQQENRQQENRQQENGQQENGQQENGQQENGQQENGGHHEDDNLIIEDHVINHPLSNEQDITPPTKVLTTPLTESLTTPLNNEDIVTEQNDEIKSLPNNNNETPPTSIGTPPSIDKTPPLDDSIDHTPSWRRSSSYENLNSINMPHPPTPPTHQPRPQHSPLLLSKGTSPWNSKPHLSPSSYQPRPFPPTYLTVTQSDDDLLNERSKRRTLTLSVRSYDTDTPVTTGRLPSTLVFEIEEGSHHKRHIVAINSIHASKLKKQLTSFTKLHIYNDHTFIATHIKGKQLCGVCTDKVSGLFGKQCYICRDCSFLVHKECHFKIEIPCPKSKVSQMCLIYPDSVSSISQF